MKRHRRQHGFSLIEVLAVVGITGIVAAVALPAMSRTSGDMRSRGDARNVFNMVSLAKMRSAAQFTRARVFVDLTSNNFYLQTCDRASNTWLTEGGLRKTSPGVAFGFGTIPTPPPQTQTAILQAPACQTACDSTGTAIGNSACIVFNSRGIPILPNGSPTGEDAFYLTDGTGVYATTLTATPLVRMWWTPARVAAWVKQ